MTSPPCSIILSYSIFFSASVVFPNLFLIFVNKSSAVLISDSLLASSSNKLSFYASAIPFCMYDNTHAIWVVPSSSVIFILKYRWATLINMLTFSILSLNTWGLVTSTLLSCCWRSMVVTYCCRVAIMLRSYSSQVEMSGQDAGYYDMVDNDDSDDGKSNYLKAIRVQILHLTRLLLSYWYHNLAKWLSHYLYFFFSYLDLLYKKVV